MADSEKKKRRSKEAPLEETPVEPAPVEPVEDSAVKSKRKSKKSVAASADPKNTDEKNGAEPQEVANKESEPIEEKAVDSETPSDDVAAKGKRKSRKSVQESHEANVKEESKPQEEKAAAQVEASDSPSDKKNKKRTGSKASVSEQEKPADAVTAQTDNPNRTSAPKRRQSMIGKFFDKIMGKGDLKEKEKPKEQAKAAEVAPAKEDEAPQVTEEAVQEEAPRKKKKKAPKAAAEEPEPEPETVEGEYEEGAEYQEEDVAEEEAPKLALPRMPPPSAPKKAPAGPIKQGPDVTSVFSMKPQIKVEVEETEVAKEYDAEEVKREVSFHDFCAAKPQYTIGDEIDGTAYYRLFTAKSSQSPEQVVIKFYSNEPPRLIPEERIEAHIELVKSLSNAHVLPILDQFVGDAYTEPVKSKGKESASSGDENEDQAVEAVSSVVEVEERAAADPVPEEGTGKKKKRKPKVDETEAAGEGAEAKPSEATESSAVVPEASSEKKKSKKKHTQEAGNTEEEKVPSASGTPQNPTPKVGAPPVKPDDAPVKPKTVEHDRFLVFEALRDVAHYARESGEQYTEQTVAKIVTGVLKALECVHGAGYMHRAVAPVNVLVDAHGEARLSGFDMACKINEPAGVVMTSEQFKATEITHSQTHNQMVDLWGVGALTYFMLTGRPTFRETNNARLKIAIREANVVYEPQDWADISPSAQEFCKALLKKDPNERLSLESALAHQWLSNAPAQHLSNASANLKI